MKVGQLIRVPIFFQKRMKTSLQIVLINYYKNLHKNKLLLDNHMANFINSDLRVWKLRSWIEIQNEFPQIEHIKRQKFNSNHKKPEKNQETLYLSRHLWLENETKDYTTQTTPPTLLTIEAAVHKDK